MGRRRTVLGPVTSQSVGPVQADARLKANVNGWCSSNPIGVGRLAEIGMPPTSVNGAHLTGLELARIEMSRQAFRF